MNSKLLIGLLVLVAGVGVGWYVLKGSQPKEKMMNEETSKQMPAPGTTGVEEKVVVTEPATGSGDAMEKPGVRLSDIANTVVTYTDSGYSPNAVTIKKGTTVTFVNQSNGGMWTASAVHPTHQQLPGFDELTSVAKAGMYEYTFEKVGTWKYHNHMAPSFTGTVVVTE